MFQNRGRERTAANSFDWVSWCAQQGQVPALVGITAAQVHAKVKKTRRPWTFGEPVKTRVQKKGQTEWWDFDYVCKRWLQPVGSGSRRRYALDRPVSSSLGGRQPFLQVTHMAMDSNHRLCTETHRVSAKNMVVLLVLGLYILLILIYNKVVRGICSPMNPNLTWIFGSEEATRSKSKDPVLSWPNTFFHMTGCS